MNDGDRLGKYQVSQELEAGLWLANRVEDFEQQVAVALCPASLVAASSSSYLDRRRKLAALDHPAIPRLLDSGETAGQRPYLLFELIPAEAALTVARAEKWPLSRRISTSINFLDALAVAHGGLVAHGRLTEDSFRISSAGQVRLPIFPIEVTQADPTSADLSAAVTLLSSLIADCRLPRLPADLKAILAKAQCANSTMAYLSAHALAADLRAFLDRKPVSARRASPLYRGTLLARRRPEFFYPAVVLAAAVLAATLYSAAVDAAARRSRNQAQTRLRQLQQLTYSLESDIYEPVSRLPNSDAARQALIGWTSESLDRLAAQAGNDAQLRAQLAQSYQRLAQMQRGNGDAAAALLSEQRARAVLSNRSTQ